MLRHAVEPAPSASTLLRDPRWLRLKRDAAAVGQMQTEDGSIDPVDHELAHAADAVRTLRDDVLALVPLLPYDRRYLNEVAADLDRWIAGRLGVPDLTRSLDRFQAGPERIDGLQRVVVLPGTEPNPLDLSCRLEVGLLRVVWPEWLAHLGSTETEQRVPMALVDCTVGYANASAGLEPTVRPTTSSPETGLGVMYVDVEASRFRTTISAIAETTALELPDDLLTVLGDDQLTQEILLARDLVRDDAASRSDLPFDPFMIRQRMPFWTYALEELRCDLTAYQVVGALDLAERDRARLVQGVIILDRALFRPISSSRDLNPQVLAGQMLFAYLHQHRVINWADNSLIIEWEQMPAAVAALLGEIDDLYWRSIDRPRLAHWLAAYELVTASLPPHPASLWAKGPEALPVEGTPDELIDVVRSDEFPLSMFFEALDERVRQLLTGASAHKG